LYDLLASEHEELDGAGRRRARPIEHPRASVRLLA
jgi:hypothetical protein